MAYFSRAIMGYMVDQYGPDDTLYPRNPEARALVNQRLYFDYGNMFASVFGYYVRMHFAILNKPYCVFIFDFARDFAIIAVIAFCRR